MNMESYPYITPQMVTYRHQIRIVIKNGAMETEDGIMAI